MPFLDEFVEAESEVLGYVLEGVPSVGTLSLVVVLALCAGAAYAGCGVKDTHEGTLKSFDADKNVIVVAVADDEEVKLTLTDDTQVADAEGNEAEVAKLVGKAVKIVSEHAKVDSIQQIA